MVRPEGNGYTTQYIMEPTGAERRPLRFETIYFMVAMLIYSWHIHNTLTAHSNHHLCECSDALSFLNAVLLKTICTIVCPKVASNVRYAKMLLSLETYSLIHTMRLISLFFEQGNVRYLHTICQL